MASDTTGGKVSEDPFTRAEKFDLVYTPLVA